jgi:hypothetical protein
VDLEKSSAPRFDPERLSFVDRTSLHACPAASPVRRHWRPGDVLNERYTVVDLVGEGGIGLVYRVQDALRPGPDLALKTLSPSTVGSSRARFLKSEFRTMAELSHPNIARVHDFERIAGTDEYCFTMEFLEGRDLLTVRGEPLERILDYTVEACRALHYLHSRRVVHADFKPQNVIVTTAGRLKVLDFGLSGMVHEGVLQGTPAYVAPELWNGNTADARVDLYALGITMYQLIYGGVPFSGPSILEIQNQHVYATLPFPDGDRTPDLVRRVITRLCEKRPEDRFGSAEEVIAALGVGSARAYEPETAETRRSYVSSARLVGRDAAEDALLSYCGSRLSLARPGRDDAVLACVSGPSGIGKSRLVKEVRRSLQLDSVPFIETRCYEGASDELQPLRDSIEALVRLGRAHGAEEVEHRHKTSLGWLVERATSPAQSISEEESLRMAALRDLAEFVLDVSGRLGFVLSMGDLHWGRTAVTDFLRILCEQQVARGDAGRAARLALIVDYRDGEPSEPLEGLLSAIAPERRLPIALTPLPPSHTAELVASMLGADDVPRSFSDRVAAETGGNPLFIEEVMRALMERGDVYMDAGRWAASTEVAHIEIPPTVAAVLERRVASVDARVQDVLDWLSVYAQPMPESFLAEVSGHGVDGVREALRTLVERQMAVPDGAGRFRPAHDKLREYLYARMPASARLARHASIARLLERSAREDADYVIERAHHYWHAGDDERARTWAERAAKFAEETFATDVAIDNCERVRQLAERCGDEHARRAAVDKLLELCTISGHYERLLAVSEAELARRTDVVERARIRQLQGEALGSQGKLAEGVERLREAAALLGAKVPRSKSARRLFIAAHYVRALATVALRRGAPSQARRLAPNERRQRTLLGACFWVMSIYAALDGDDEGYGLVFAGINAALPLGHHEVLTRLLVNGAFVSHAIGRYRASERLFRMAQRSARSEQERTIVLIIGLLARQLVQRPMFAEQPPVQAHEADLLRALELLSTRSKEVHANVARMVVTTTVCKYAARHEPRPDVARWAEAMRGTVHYGYVQGAVAVMAQIDGDARRASRAYALADQGCTTDVYRSWIAADFAYVCAVTNDTEKALACVETVRRLLPGLEMRSAPTAWAAAMAVATCIVLDARGATPAWLRTCLEEIVARLDRVRRLPVDVRVCHQAGRAALGRADRHALHDAVRASRATWLVEQSKSGYADSCLVGALALRRSRSPEDARAAAEWAREAIAVVEARFPAGYARHVREAVLGTAVRDGNPRDGNPNRVTSSQL